MITKEDLEALGFTVLSGGAGLDNNQIRCVCNNPQCKDQVDKRGRLYVNSDNGLYFCFRCGNKGKISLDRNRMFDNSYLLDRIEEELRDEHGIGVVVEGVNYSELEMNNLVTPYNQALDRDQYLKFCGGLKSPPRIYNYAKSRGITDEEIYRYKIKFGIVGKYSNRFIIPVFQEGRLRTFIARYAGKSDLKYLHPGKLNIDDVIFYSRPVERNRKLIITEGILDAISCSRCGYVSAAILGKNPKKERLKRLKQIKNDYDVELVFYYDSDVLYGPGYSIDIIYNKISEVLNTDEIYITCPQEFGRDPGDSSCSQINSDIGRRTLFSNHSLLSSELSIKFLESRAL